MKTVLCALPMVALLAGCASLSNDKIARFESMSCAQLAVAFEYEDEGEREAGNSALLNTLTSLTSKGDLAAHADLDTLDDQLDEDEHRMAKDYIRDRQDYLAC